MAANSAARFNRDLRVVFERLTVAGKVCKTVIIALANTLLAARNAGADANLTAPKGRGAGPPTA